MIEADVDSLAHVRDYRRLCSLIDRDDWASSIKYSYTREIDELEEKLDLLADRKSDDAKNLITKIDDLKRKYLPEIEAANYDIRAIKKEMKELLQKHKI